MFCKKSKIISIVCDEVIRRKGKRMDGWEKNWPDCTRILTAYRRPSGIRLIDPRQIQLGTAEHDTNR